MFEGGARGVSPRPCRRVGAGGAGAPEDVTHLERLRDKVRAVLLLQLAHLLWLGCGRGGGGERGVREGEDGGSVGGQRR